MNDKNNKLNIGELKQSASPSSAKADVTAENIYNRKKALIKMGAIGALLIVMIIFGTISWFTQNREVESSGMTISTATLPFDIATKGNAVRNQTVINSKKPEYVEGASGTYFNPAGTSGTYYSDDSLLLRFTPVEDDPETADVDEGETPDISPGSSGELSLYVIPKTNSSMNVKVSLNVVAFAEIDKYKTVESPLIDEETGQQATDPDTGELLTTSSTTKDGTQIIEINSNFATAANAVNNSTAAGEANKYIAAADYLKGHILFFGGLGETISTSGSSGSETTWKYYYTTPYTSRVIDQTIASGNEGKAVQVPIYWMWTNTLGQIALQTNTNNLRSGIPVVRETVVNTSDDTETDKELLLAYLNTNKSSIFTGTETITQDMIYNADTLANFDTLSKQYNAADYEIGTRIAYFMIEVTVESG